MARLADSQVRESVLREHFKECTCKPMLYLPSDSTALDSAIRQAKREVLLEAERLGGRLMTEQKPVISGLQSNRCRLSWNIRGVLGNGDWFPISFVDSVKDWVLPMC